MPARHRSRQRALQILYQTDMRGESVRQAIDHFYDTLHSEDENAEKLLPDPFMEKLAVGTAEKSAEIDRRIAEKSANWRIDRMSVVDRNILRLAIYEMLDNATPAPVVIDEALELARQFSGEESVSFINGVLDAVHKEIPN